MTRKRITGNLSRKLAKLEAQFPNAMLWRRGDCDRPIIDIYAEYWDKRSEYVIILDCGTFTD